MEARGGPVSPAELAALEGWEEANEGMVVTSLEQTPEEVESDAA